MADDNRAIAATLAAAIVSKTDRGGLVAEEAVEIYLEVLSVLAQKTSAGHSDLNADSERRAAADHSPDGVRQTKIYHSENGDSWFLCRDQDGHAYVGHQPNKPSGGQFTRIEIHDFLGQGRSGPEHRALIALIGTHAGV
jgi:hypothetical protein